MIAACGDMKLHSILRVFQHCCACGAPNWKGSHLCEECFEQVSVEIINWQHLVTARDWRGFPLLSLGTYRSSAISGWVKALKGGSPGNDFKQIAIEWLKLRQIVVLSMPAPPIYIVPSPSRRGIDLDHAYCLALALSQLTGWPMRNILTFQQVEVSSQKLKKAVDRRERKFQLRKGTETPKGTFIFIDDVVTTGSTVEAAWKALGKPSQFEVWCIAYQPMLAAKPQV